MRRGHHGVNLICLFTIGLAVLFVLPGCDSPQESSYKASISSMIDRWNALSAQARQASDESVRQMKEAAKNGDPNAALAQIRTAVDTFIAKFAQAVEQTRGLQAELSRQQVPPKYATEHKILLNGMSTAVNSLDNQLQAAGLLRNLQPGQMEAAQIQIETADTYLKQGIDNLNLATGYLFPVNWPLVIGCFVLLLGACTGFGIWSGKLAARHGRSFKGFFCLGFFLGLLGVGIAYLVIRRADRKALRDEQQTARMPGFQVGSPGGSVFLSDLLSDGVPFDGPPVSEPPGRQVAAPEPFRVPPQRKWVEPPGGAVSTGSVTPQARRTPPAPAPQQASAFTPPDTPDTSAPGSLAAPFGHCPACGVRLPQPGAFCLRCGAPIPQPEF